MPCNNSNVKFTLANLKEILRKIPGIETPARPPASRRPSFDLTLETVYENEPLKLSND